MDRRDFFYRQRVTESELDDAFAQAEEADWRFAVDIGLFGIVDGFIATQHDPVADMTVDLSGPARAYDRTGRRIYCGIDENVDCSVDENGVSTAVAVAGQERWIAVFAAFDRQLSDERIDGNSAQVFFQRDESYSLVVRQGTAAAADAAVRVPFDDGMVLLFDVKITNGMASILNGDIDTTRRQNFEIYDASQITIDPDDAAFWTRLNGATVQQVFDNLDTLLDGHFDGVSNKHSAAHIIYDDAGNTYATGADVQAALDAVDARLVTDAATLTAHGGRLDALEAFDTSLADTTAPNNGGRKIGVPAVADTLSLATTTVYGQLLELIGHVNTIWDVLPRSVGSGDAQVNATATVNIVTVTVEPTGLIIRVKEVDGANNPIGDYMYQGAEPSGGGWTVESVAVWYVNNGDGTYTVKAKNNNATNVRVYVDVLRVN